jgi:hypothetical protein
VSNSSLNAGTFSNITGVGTLGSLTVSGDATISGLTVGKGGGAGTYNTVVGSGAGTAITTGATITAMGYRALYANTSGNNNVAFGESALLANTTGSSNTAVGVIPLGSNTTGGNNVAVGQEALRSNTTASNNTAVGYQAGYSNTTGQYNVFVGWSSGLNATGTSNVGIGNQAAKAATGSFNTCIGDGSGLQITSGSYNVILGSYQGNSGGLDIRTASNYIVLSDGAGNPRAYWNGTGQATFTATSGTGLSVVNNFTGNGTPLILTQSATNVFNAMEIRNSGSTAVFIVAANGNATNTNNSYGGISDIKLKENIVDATPKLEDLCKVKVRQYNLKSEPDRKQIGVIAQELEEVFAGLVEESIDRDGEGEDLGTTTKTVKYSVFVPMLIKAIQELKADNDSMRAALKAAGIAGF